MGITAEKLLELKKNKLEELRQLLLDRQAEFHKLERELKMLGEEFELEQVEIRNLADSISKIK